MRQGNCDANLLLHHALHSNCAILCIEMTEPAWILMKQRRVRSFKLNVSKGSAILEKKHR